MSFAAGMADLSRLLSEVAALDGEIAAAKKAVDKLTDRRKHLARLAAEEMIVQRLDGVRVSGRSWRVEWEHHCSVDSDSRKAVLEAAERIGQRDLIVTVNTSRLKGLLRELAEDAGKEARAPRAEGTVFEGLVSEYAEPVLRHLTVG